MRTVACTADSGIIHYIQHFLQEYREYTRGRGVNPVACFQKVLVLATAPVRETSLPNHSFLGRERGYVKRVLSVCL